MTPTPLQAEPFSIPCVKCASPRACADEGECRKQAAPSEADERATFENALNVLIEMHVQKEPAHAIRPAHAVLMGLWQARAQAAAPAGAQPIAWRDVIAERQRQVDVEGWTPEHDNAHPAGDFERAAATYALYSYGVAAKKYMTEWSAPLWPWDWKWLKPKGQRRDLVRAAALLLAAIEKYDREAIAKGYAAPPPVAAPTAQPGIIHGGFELPAASLEGLTPSQAMAVIAELAAVQTQRQEDASDIPPPLDDEGRAMIVNSHHYTAENIAAMVERLRAFADPQRTTQAELDAIDWRGQCNVWGRVMGALLAGVEPAAPPPQAQAPQLPDSFFPLIHAYADAVRKDDGTEAEFWALVKGIRALLKPAALPGEALTDAQINDTISKQSFWQYVVDHYGVVVGPELHDFARAIEREVRASVAAAPPPVPQWQPIETAATDRLALLYAPPQALHVEPEGKPGEYRVAAPRNWTWATHWMPLPASTSTPTAAPKEAP